MGGDRDLPALASPFLPPPLSEPRWSKTNALKASLPSEAAISDCQQAPASRGTWESLFYLLDDVTR